MRVVLLRRVRQLVLLLLLVFFLWIAAILIQDKFPGHPVNMEYNWRKYGSYFGVKAQLITFCHTDFSQVQILLSKT